MIDPNTNRRYSVYVLNNNPLEEIDPNGRPIELDGRFVLRSVGRASWARGRSWKKRSSCARPIMDMSQDSFGGGPGNINPPSMQ